MDTFTHEKNHNHMKNLKFLVIALVMSVSSISFTSCNSGEKEPNPLADSLANLNNELGGKLTEKEQALQEFVTTFNEIQANLNEIKEKEKIVTTSAKGGDVKSKEDQIKEDIQAIYDLMGKNKSRINSLTKKLKASKSQIKGLEEMIANLQAQLTDKDNQITELKSQIEALNIELSNINTNYEEVEQEVEVKTEKLNTAYYAFGTAKELKEKGITTKEGGFIGLGKSTKVKDDFNKEYFTKIDVTQTSSINIGAKKVKILSTHPSSSYKLVGEKSVEKIEILNAEEFWGASKYLVIVIE
jgi:DNA repair exonuclease SbcCD ATPase subunit